MKRIITCSDGTWNKIETDVPTNVLKMFKSICAKGRDPKTNREVTQLKAYDEGVGSGYTFRDKFFGGATGAGLDKNIKDMYTFIALNYEVGDEIYLFGFSRGAYTARSLAGFIRNCGLLRSDYWYLLPEAYRLYRDRNDYSTADSDMMNAWRNNYCIENTTCIKFIGVWDTVGSLGIPLPLHKFQNLHKYKFHDVKLSSTIQYAYHALAIDERRSLFTPTLWEISDTAKNDKSKWQTMEQMWFTGVHSNVGGGYPDSGLSDIALDWLFTKAQDVGLCFFDPPAVTVNKNIGGKLTNSFTPLYWFWRPRWRNILSRKNNQYIHETAFERFESSKNYRPLNLSFYKNLSEGKTDIAKIAVANTLRDIAWLTVVSLFPPVAIFIIFLILKGIQQLLPIL